MGDDVHPTTDVDSVGEQIDVGDELFAGDVEDVKQMREDLSTIDRAEMDTLTMEVTVDIGDMNETNKRILHALADQYERAFQEVVEKNRSYGFAFIETGGEIARRPNGQFNTPTRATANGLFHRTGDKRARFYRRMFTDCDDAGEDPVSQTAKECGNYWLMMSVVADNPDLVNAHVDDS